MATITGGKISFSRTVKVSDYEPKRAEVELTFSALEGESITAEFLNSVGQQAQTKCLELLGLAKAPIAVTDGGVPVADTPKPRTRKAASPPVTQPAEDDGFGGPTTASTAAAPSAQTTPATSAAQVSAGAASATAEQSADTWDEPPPAEVSDKILVGHIQARNQVIKAPAKIHTLVAEFAGPAPKTFKDIPQPLRQKFLDRLQALT